MPPSPESRLLSRVLTFFGLFFGGGPPLLEPSLAQPLGRALARMNKPVLLTVDDDPEVLNAIERDLRHHFRADYRVVKASSGAAGPRDRPPAPAARRARSRSSSSTSACRT